VTGAGLVARLLTAGFALLAPVGILVPNGLAVLLGVLGFAVLAEGRLAALAHLSRPFLLIVGAIVALGGLSVAWAVDPAEGGEGWVRSSLTMFGGLLVAGRVAGADARVRGAWAGAFLAGYALAAAIMAVQVASMALWTPEQSLFSLWSREQTNYSGLMSRPACVLAILAPVGIFLARRRHGTAAAGALALAVAGAVFGLDSLAASTALIAAAAVGGFAVAVPRAAPVAMAAGLALAVLAAPVVAASDALHGLAERRDVSVSIFHRAAIWQFAAERIAEKPLLGWGMRSARAIPAAKETVAQNAELMPLHPHNGPLHVWLEFGAAGALLTAALLALLALRGRGAPAHLATLAAGFAVGAVSYGIWQGWWHAFLWLAAAAVLVAVPTGSEGTEK
jgi:O-antigen ligase